MAFVMGLITGIIIMLVAAFFIGGTVRKFETVDKKK